MSAKLRINSALTRLTGHHLAKGAPGAQLAQSQQELARVRQELREARQKLGRAGGNAGPGKPKGDGFPPDYDDVAKDIIRAVKPFTMTGNEKLFGLIQAMRYLVRNNVPGDIVECGVWRGGSMHAAARTLNELGVDDRHLYLFDTFEGMTEPTEVDVRRDGMPAAELLKTKEKTAFVWAIASLDDVKAGFEQVPYPKENVHYVVGGVENTIPGELPERIAMLRLDTDWYESTKHELENAYSRLSPGGVLIIDDYAHWQGSKKATDEFMASLDEPLLLHRMGDGRIGVKPFTGAA